MPRELNIKPTVGLLAMMKNMDYTEYYAIAEYVDNSVQSYWENKKKLKSDNSNYKLKVKIELTPTEITIKDNAGGISDSRYDAAFEAGKPPPNTKGLSEFGVGMKIASCWFADKWKIHTKAIDENKWKLVEFDMKKILDKNLETLEVTESKVSSKASYTIVTLTRLHHKPKGRSIQTIKDHISSMYRHLINSGEIEILIDNKKLIYDGPEIRYSPYYKDWLDGNIKKPRKYNWFKKFEFEFQRGTCRGYVAIRKKGKVDQEGFGLFRRKRLIIGSEGRRNFKPYEIFGLGNDRKQQVLFGEVHMDHMNVSFAKNEFIWNENEKQKFISLLSNATEFLDKEKKLNIHEQAKEWKQSMERSDIRERSKKGLSQVGKFMERGLQQTSSQLTPEAKPLTKKHERVKEKESSAFRIDFEGKVWTITIEYEYDETKDYLYDVEIADKKNEEITVFINLTHNFVGRFFGDTEHDVKGLTILLAYIAITEVQVWKFDGVREASLLRERLNNICRNIPPKT